MNTIVNITIDGVILYCDESVTKLNIGNGYKIEKRYFDEIPYKDRLVDNRGRLLPQYIGSQRQDEYGIYFMCIHKDDKYEIDISQMYEPNARMTIEDLFFEDQLYAYKEKEMKYLYRQISLLHLFKEGNIGYYELFVIHNFKLIGFLNQNLSQTDHSLTKNTIDETFFSLSDSEVAQCNFFIQNVTDQEYNLIKDNITVFTDGLEQIMDSTSLEKYTTVLNMTLLKKNEDGIKEIMAKRTAVLLETDPQKVLELYNKIKVFYKQRSTSAHEGKYNAITKLDLKEYEQIVRRVLVKYLEFCKAELSVNPSITWDEIRKKKADDLKTDVTVAISKNILPK